MVEIIMGKVELKDAIDIIDEKINLCIDCEKSQVNNSNYAGALESQTERICLSMLRRELLTKTQTGRIRT